MTYVRATYEAHRANQSKTWTRAQEGEAVARRHNCTGCHTMRESRLVVSNVPCEGTIKLSEKDRHYVSWLADPRTLALNDVQRAHPSSVPADRVSRIEPRDGGTMAERLLRVYQPANDTKRDEILSFAPPSLRMPGRKFSREWLMEFLRAPSPLRPKLERAARMPDFAFEARELDALMAWFDARAAEPRPSAPKNWKRVDAVVRETCLQCHALDGVGKPDAPDLARLGRLTRPWLDAFMRDPSVFIPRTAMPPLREEHREGMVDYLLAYDEVRALKLRDGDATVVRGLRTSEDLRLAAQKFANDRDAALVLLEVARDASDLAPLLTAESGEVRRLTIELWAERGIGADSIAARLEDHDADVRLTAVRALVRLGAQGAAPAIAKLIDEQDPTVRQTALEALRRLRARAQAPAVARLLKDPSENLRKTALDVLVSLGARDQAVAIAGALRDEQLSVRRAALDALIALDARTQAPAISELLDDPLPALRSMAARALADLQADDEWVVRLLEDNEPAVRWAAAVYLARMGAASAKFAFQHLLRARPLNWLTPEVLRDGVNELNVLGRRDVYEKLRRAELAGGEKTFEQWIRAVAGASDLRAEIDASVEPLVTGSMVLPERSAARVLNEITRRQRVAFVIEGDALKALPLSRALAFWQ